MQAKSVIPARNRRHLPEVLLWIAIASSTLLWPGISCASRDIAENPEQLPSRLRQLSQVDGLKVPDAIKAFKLAIDNYLREDYAAALDSLPDEQAANTAGVADYILFYRAKCRLNLERDKEALHDLRLLENRFPDSPLIEDALMGQCQALLKLNDPMPVLDIMKNPRIPRDSETAYYQARALELSGEKEKAIEGYLSLYSGYPKSSYSALAERHLLVLSPGALKGGRNYKARLTRAEALLNANDARAARTLLLALGRVKAPDPASSQKRNFLLADAEYRLGRTSTALTLVRKITATDPVLHSRAVLLEGRCYRKLKREQSLLSQRDKALKLYPNSRETEELCHLVATYFDLEYKHAKAREAYRVLSDHFPKGRYAERALWKLALFHYSAKEHREAAREFWRYLLAYPKPVPAGSAMYWIGRCYELLGGSQNAGYLYRRAQALVNNSYFGQCARRAEASLKKSAKTESVSIPGIDFEKVIHICDAIQHPAILLPEPGSAALPAIERARLLWAAGLQDMALFELRSASNQFAHDEKAIAYIMSWIHGSKNDHLRAIQTARSIFPDYANQPVSSLHDDFWRLMFPAPHWSIITAQAKKNQLDPCLVLGLIRQESAFNEKARSVANARGLMQLLPSTALTVARNARIRPYSAQRLYQAGTNIPIGTRFLASLMQRYGKAELALAAYNAGGTRVDRWLKEFGGVEMAEFVERIPFGETREYVKRVLDNQAIYSLLISSGTVAVP
ncbi:MAG: transglycosylase SLT domain-containing protein [Acidobacteria bacterium]|nr:transglycosylase SLT domain-containing protein [Acidobacteriota bacterium]